MTTILAWFIAGSSTAGLVTLWFVIAYQELSHARQCIENAAEQLSLHKNLYPKAKNSPDGDAATHALDTTKMIYREVIKNYEYVRHKPMNRFPGFILGFREMKFDSYENNLH